MKIKLTFCYWRRIYEYKYILSQENQKKSKRPRKKELTGQKSKLTEKFLN